MFAYKLTAVFATTILAAAIAVAFAYAPANTKDVTLSKRAKLDISASQHSECPKIAWPYGCEWHPSVTPPTKHVLVQRHGRLYRLFANTGPPAAFLGFLRQLNSPIAPRPVAKSGSAPRIGVAVPITNEPSSFSARFPRLG